MKITFHLILTRFAIAFACEFRISPELLNACSFDSLVLVNPTSGFVIADESCGLEIDKDNFLEQPFVFYSDAIDYVKYTLMMIDNDNPLAAENGSYLHWLVTDIDGQSLKYGLGIYSGKTVAGELLSKCRSGENCKFILPAYVPPDPSQETCVHRYSIYIFDQRFQSLEFPELEESRADFSLFDFIERVVPEGGICGPVASVEFKSRY